MEEIDFDAASTAWMANKIRKGEMVYYKCSAIQKNGLHCPLAAIQDVMAPTKLCKRHTKCVSKGYHSAACSGIPSGIYIEAIIQ